ncbi:TetR/AcrR family transcriptional regulator [Microbacterium enclense]|uniref:Transcriptional regulator, TetR family n=1 Tax=Microbacterium enclense TaxID=993073 RepID=A0A1G6MRS4_9MICO|nr:TetR/AcrR family transcriptional regulator [Microbacterium enclense]KSU53854.1 TetR family transcriptional regulator [Microbacterium enclense]MCM3615254.1 TetR/AcrR family transcriptional regulator [Microbacterium enclense]SDC57904.1 transcriptional regulator, TetR family [Microbacterium enclense]
MTAADSATTTADAPARRGRPGYDRDGILAVAVQLFNEQGYDATSVSDLARRLGLAKSALYHHFSSKEELLSVALEAALGGLEAVLDDPRASAGAASDRLRFVLTGATDVLVAQLPSVTLLLRVRGNGPVEQAALERRRVFDHRVTDLVAAAQAEGDVRDDVDAAVAARLLFGMINSVVEWYRPGGGVDGGRLGADIVRIALDGLRTS